METLSHQWSEGKDNATLEAKEKSALCEEQTNS